MNTQALTLSNPTSATHDWLDTAAYPFTPQRFATAEGALSYVDVGNAAGGTVLFVHGTPSWSFEFRNVIKRLSPRRRCVALDHLGFGLSDKPQGAGYRPEDHARRLRALVEHLDLRDITLVVHDFGVPIGVPVALDMPERVHRIVMLNGFMWPNGDDPAVRKIDRVVRSWFGRFLYRVLNLSPRVLLPASVANKKALSRSVRRHYVKPFPRRGDRESLYQLACALLGSSDFYSELWNRRQELADRITDIVWGERDPAFQEHHLARWTEAFPTARVTRLPAVGHFVAEEAPDALARILGA